eukprot:GHVS01014857.1.p1 GENE.GHVS01014857.1~~GHVS01014857.1.p1  ORF type:complete len:937 (+),score=154.25 GHVS01014857.1:346-2811(+)
MASGLSVEKVLELVNLRGGFGAPIQLPGDLGSLNISRDILTAPLVNFKNNRVDGKMREKLGLEAKLNIPGIAGMDGIETKTKSTNIFDARGDIGLKSIGERVVNNLHMQQEVDAGRLGQLSVSGGGVGIIDGRADLENGIAHDLYSNRGGLLNAEGPLGALGSGTGSYARLQSSLNDKQLRSQLVGSEGGRTTVEGDVVSGGVGFLGSGNLMTNVDLKKASVSNNIFRQSGTGGSVAIGDGVAGGGVGQTLDGQSYLDVKNAIAGVDLLSEVGADGNIRLPGNLGGLMYDVKDVTDVAGHIDLKDLSTRSLQILKQTDILAVIDLPGDRLESITIEAHPKIDTSKLGRLNVLSFASQFAEDIKSITDFNMLSEINLIKAITSGSEFLARLDILDALRHTIGSIVALPEVAVRVKAVLTDMASILETLKRVKVFPIHVRTLGEAMAKFDVSELVVELPQLEALAAKAADLLPGEGVGSGDLSDIVKDVEEQRQKIEERVFAAIPNAVASFSEFVLDPLMDKSKIVEKITEAAANVVNLNGIVDEAGKLVKSAADNLGDAVQSVGGLDIVKVVNIANIADIDLNEIGNIDAIMNLGRLDEAFRTPLENLIKIANLQEVELNELLDVAELAHLNLNNIEDLSDILDTDLADLDLFDIGLTKELDRLLLEPLEGIVTDVLGNAIVDVDIGELNLGEIVKNVTEAGIDINDLDEFEKVVELLGLRGDAAAQLEKLIRISNFNGIDLSKVPLLASYSDLDITKLADLQSIVGNANIGKVLEDIDVMKVGEALKSLKGVAGNVDVGNVVKHFGLSETVAKIAQGIVKN